VVGEGGQARESLRKEPMMAETVADFLIERLMEWAVCRRQRRGPEPSTSETRRHRKASAALVGNVRKLYVKGGRP
jgi:hypothetical protein